MRNIEAQVERSTLPFAGLAREPGTRRADVGRSRLDASPGR